MAELLAPPGWWVRESGPNDEERRRQLITATFSVGTTPNQNTLRGRYGEHPPTREGAWQTIVEDDRQRLVATAGVTLRGQWIAGRRLISAAISSVAVDRSLRGHGIGSIVMSKALGTARERGAALSTLVPSVHGFYRRLGYGIAGTRPIFRLATRDLLRELPRPPLGYEVRQARPEDTEAIAELIRRRAELAHGSLDQKFRLDSPADPIDTGAWVLERDDHVRGFCRVRREPTMLREPIYTAVVEDILGETESDEVALWRDVVADVPAAFEAEALLLPGGRLEHLLERRLVPVEAGTWMLRVLDLESALLQRGYPCGLSQQVTVTLTDSLIPGNTGTWSLKIHGGSATLSRGTTVSSDVICDIADFSSLYMGFIDPVGALSNGWIQGSQEGAERLRSIFQSPAASLFSTF